MTETTTHTMHCGAAGCNSSVSITTVRKSPDRPQFKNAVAMVERDALAEAACCLGWRRIFETNEFRCLVHTDGLVCDRCGFEVCSCMGGPRFDVRVGDKDDE